MSPRITMTRAHLLTLALLLAVVATVPLGSAVCVPLHEKKSESKSEAAVASSSAKTLSVGEYLSPIKVIDKPKEEKSDEDAMSPKTSTAYEKSDESASSNKKSDDSDESAYPKKEKEKSNDDSDESASSKMEKEKSDDDSHDSASPKMEKKEKSDDDSDKSASPKKEKKEKSNDDSDESASSKKEKKKSDDDSDDSASPKKEKKEKSDDDSDDSASPKKEKKDKSDDSDESVFSKREKEKSDGYDKEKEKSDYYASFKKEKEEKSDESASFKKEKKEKSYESASPKKENKEKSDESASPRKEKEEKSDEEATPVDISSTGAYVSSNKADSKPMEEKSAESIESVSPKKIRSQPVEGAPDELPPAAKSSATPDAYASPEQAVSHPSEPAKPKVTVESLPGMAKKPVMGMLSPVIKGLCAKTDYPDVCESSIGGLPGGALAQADAVGVLKLAMEAVRLKAIEAMNAATDRMHAPGTEAAAQNALDSCTSSYSDIRSSLDTVEDALKRGDVATARTNLDSVSTDVDTCEDGFTERDAPSLMADHDQELKKLASNLLAIGAAIDH